MAARARSARSSWTRTGGCSSTVAAGIADLDARDLAVLDENQGRDNHLIRDVVSLALRSANTEALTSPHAGIFPGPEAPAVE